MSNFLIKSKDIYFQDTEKYRHFKTVFSKIQELSISKNYYDTNLFNIEEILSILEMGSFHEGKKLKNDFTKYILDTISYYTPAIKPYGKSLPGNWYDFIFGNRGIESDFGYFVGSLFGASFGLKEKSDYGENYRNLWVTCGQNEETNYSVLSLNYDMVLENYCHFMNSQYHTAEKVSFNKEGSPEWNKPSLFKLHGCAEAGTIVPPTWAKGTHRKVIPTWKNAYQTLLNSTHIRFIGYSLPLSDSYIKYLLKSSVVNAPHLKQIDVICLDSDGSVKNRFDYFIQYDYYRYKNGSVKEYFEELYQVSKHQRYHPGNAPVVLNKLEVAHENFMS